MTPDCRSDIGAIKLSFLINVWKIRTNFSYILLHFFRILFNLSLNFYLPLFRSLPCTFSEPMRVADIREGIARANREVSDKFNSFFKHIRVCVCVLYKLPSMLSSFVIPLKTAPNKTTHNSNSLFAFDSLYDSNTMFYSK